jgi:hypothetical protein
MGVLMRSERAWGTSAPCGTNEFASAPGRVFLPLFSGCSDPHREGFSLKLAVVNLKYAVADFIALTLTTVMLSIVPHPGEVGEGLGN